MKLNLDRHAWELAAQDPIFTRIARTATRFFGVGCGAISLRLPCCIAYIGRHGIPFGKVPEKYDLGKHADHPQIFRDLRKSRTKAFRQLSQLHGGIGFFACVPIYDFHMNRIGLLWVRDSSPMDHPVEKLATLQDLANIAFEHLVLLLRTLDYPMLLGDEGLRPSIRSSLSPASAINLFGSAGLETLPSSFQENKIPKFNEEPVSNFLIRTLNRKDRSKIEKM